ncbi:MAG: tetratricopeptide repeat protein [Ramlibacter sp.]
MSLINKMLQDLEQRQASTPQNEPIVGEVRSARAVTRSNTGLLVSLMLLTVAVIVAGVWAFMQLRSEPAVLVVAAAPAKPPLAVKPVEAMPAPTPAAVTPVVTAPAPVVTAPAQVAQPAAAMASPLAAATKVEPPAPVKPKETVAAKAPEAAPAKAAAPVVEAKVAPVAEAKPAPVAVPKTAPVVEAKSAPIVEAKVAPPVAPAKSKPEEAKAVPVAAAVPPPKAEALPPAEKQPARAVAVAADSRPQKSVSPQQLSENLYKQSVVLVQQGKGGDARELLRQSLEAGPRNVAARQMLVGLLVESGNIEPAMALLRDGLKVQPGQGGLSINLARLQLEKADTAGAMATLEQGLAAIGDDPQYHAFYAAMLQRASRHDDAVKHYLAALRTDPSMPNWLVGIGISLQATGKESDALEAFQRAKDTGQLPAQLLAFVDQRLGQLRR